jgi:hypothetical protein
MQLGHSGRRSHVKEPTMCLLDDEGTKSGRERKPRKGVLTRARITDDEVELMVESRPSMPQGRTRGERLPVPEG